MNIGIIVFSQTGNTNYVARKLKEVLSAAGHTVGIERLKVLDDRSKRIAPGAPPDLEQYDGIIFGAPVRAFSLSPVMKNYLQQIKSLRKKKVACFVTKGLPFNWTGGNRALRQLVGMCRARGATICGTGIVKWVNSKREKDIDDIVKKMVNLFQA